jgi:hypothetical protein
MESRGRPAWYRRWAWAAVALIGGLLAVAGIGILLNPVDVGDFEARTGVAWSDTLATFVQGQARLCGSMALGVGLFAAGLASTLLRRGSSDAWWLAWVLPIVLTLMMVIFASSDALAQAMTFGIAAAVAGLAMWFARPAG